jgi:hypothetical protein
MLQSTRPFDRIKKSWNKVADFRIFFLHLGIRSKLKAMLPRRKRLIENKKTFDPLFSIIIGAAVLLGAV